MSNREFRLAIAQKDFDSKPKKVDFIKINCPVCNHGWFFFPTIKENGLTIYCRHCGIEINFSSLIGETMTTGYLDV